MTTIAYSAGVLASDQAFTDETGRQTKFNQKIRRLSDGRLAGFAGDVYTGIALLDWLETGEATPPALEGEAEVLLITLDGLIMLYDKFGRGIVIDDPVYAFGSGGDLAMGAMLAGATAERAVAIAVERDRDSGFGVTSLTLEGTSRRSGRSKK